MSPRTYTNSRHRLLDAAEAVLLKGGIGALSVDAVVKQAGLSKGAFFYLFAGKDELLAALLARLSEDVEAATAALAERDKAPGGRLRAQAAIALDAAPAEKRRWKALVLALVTAALDGGDAILAGARKANRDALRAAVADGIDPGHALVVQLALDGFFLGDALGTLALDAREKKQLRDALADLTRPAKRRKAGRK